MQKKDQMMLYRRDYLHNRKSDIQYTSLKKLCSLFGIDMEDRRKGARLAEEMFRQNCPSFGKLAAAAGAAYMLEGIGSVVFDGKFCVLEGDIVLTHPIDKMTEREQLFLAETLSALQLKKGRYRCRFLSDRKDMAAAACMAEAVRTAKQQEAGKEKKQQAAENIPGFIQGFIRTVMKELKELTETEADYGDPEVIHDIRVAFRRLYAVTDVFEDLIKTEWKQTFKSSLKREISLLGTLRDLDVRQEKIRQLMEQNGKIVKKIPVYCDMIDTSRKDTLGRVKTHCSSKEFRDFLKALEDSADAPVCLPILAKAGQAQSFRIEAVQRKYLRACYGEIESYREWLSGVYVPEPILHRLRLSFKKLRYILEFFETVSGDNNRKMAADSRWFQETLGELHDYAVLRQDIAERMPDVKRAADKQEVKSLKKLSHFAEKKMEQLYRKFIRKWNRPGIVDN